MTGVERYRWRALPAGQRGAILLGWIVLGLIETVRVNQNPTAVGVPSVPWDYALVGNFPWWFAWGLLTPLVFWFAGAVRLDEPGWIRRLPVHVGFGAAVIAVHLLMALTLWFYTNPLAVVRSRGFLGAAIGNASVYLLLELVAYGATVGLFYAVDNHRQLHAQQLIAAELAARAADLEARAADARLEALRLELSPHFLFNSLNAVSGLVRTHESQAAIRMLSRLGDLLRISLRRDQRPQVPLVEELAHLGLYLDIERQRFADRLTVRIDVSDPAKACLVPVLCLQPLVENAIKHGIATVPGAGTVIVGGRVDGDDLVLWIQDDGAGLPIPMLRREGIGLSNTRSRLRQLYGDRGRLDLGPAPGRGTVATVRLPAVPATNLGPLAVAS